MKIINTHGHIDHIADNDRLQTLFEAPVFIHRGDKDMLNDPQKMIDYFGINYIAGSSRLDGFIADGDFISIGELRFRVIQRRGILLVGICLYL